MALHPAARTRQGRVRNGSRSCVVPWAGPWRPVSWGSGPHANAGLVWYPYVTNIPFWVYQPPRRLSTPRGRGHGPSPTSARQSVRSFQNGLILVGSRKHLSAAPDRTLDHRHRAMPRTKQFDTDEVLVKAMNRFRTTSPDYTNPRRRPTPEAYEAEDGEHQGDRREAVPREPSAPSGGEDTGRQRGPGPIAGGLLAAPCPGGVQGREGEVEGPARQASGGRGDAVEAAVRLILPWIKIPNLGSHILALIRRRLPDDWTERYNTTPVLIETFVETPRYTDIPARSTGHRAGSMSEPPKDAGATTGTGSMTSRRRMSGSGPCDGIGNAPSIAKIDRGEWKRPR